MAARWTNDRPAGQDAWTPGDAGVDGVPRVDVEEVADARVADRRDAGQECRLQSLEGAQHRDPDRLARMRGVKVAPARVGVAIDHPGHDGPPAEVDNPLGGAARRQASANPGNPAVLDQDVSALAEAAETVDQQSVDEQDRQAVLLLLEPMPPASLRSLPRRSGSFVVPPQDDT